MKTDVSRTANMTWQRGGDAAAIRELADGADLLLLVECRDKNNRPVNVKAVLGKGWIVFQDLRSGARAGTVIAVRKGGSVKALRVRTALLSRAGLGVQARFMKVARLRDSQGVYSEAVVHNPLDETDLRDDAFRVAHAWWARTRGRKRLTGDVNSRAQYAQDTIGAWNMHAAAPMVQLWSRGWKGTKLARRQVGKPGFRPLDHYVLEMSRAS